MTDSNDTAPALKTVTYNVDVEDMGFVTVTHNDRRRQRAREKLSQLDASPPLRRAQDTTLNA